MYLCRYQTKFYFHTFRFLTYIHLCEAEINVPFSTLPKHSKPQRGKILCTPLKQDNWLQIRLQKTTAVFPLGGLQYQKKSTRGLFSTHYSWLRQEHGLSNPNYWGNCFDVVAKVLDQRKACHKATAQLRQIFLPQIISSHLWLWEEKVTVKCG